MEIGINWVQFSIFNFLGRRICVGKGLIILNNGEKTGKNVKNSN